MQKLFITLCLLTVMPASSFAQKIKLNWSIEARKDTVFQAKVIGYDVTLEEYAKTGKMNLSTVEGKDFFKVGGNMAQIFNELDENADYRFPYNALAHKYMLHIKSTDGSQIDKKLFAKAFYEYLMEEEE